MERTSCVLSFRKVFLYLVTMGWIFDFGLLCENSAHQSIKVAFFGLATNTLNVRNNNYTTTTTTTTVDPRLLPLGNPFKCYEEVVILAYETTILYTHVDVVESPCGRVVNCK